MNVTQKGIIILLKSAIILQPLELPADFDMDAAFPLIKQHNIVTLAYDGAVRCGISPQHPRMQELFLLYCKALQISERQEKELNRLYAAFEKNGIDYMPLKGCEMKGLYPMPELRIMGDADILIRMEQYGQIAPVLETLGFAEGATTDHELVWKSGSLYLELHKRLVPSYDEDFYTCFGDGWKLAKKRTGSRYSMMEEDTFLYLFTHFAKHYRNGGIGCRHVVDLWIYRRSYPKLDEEYLRKELEALQLLEFYENICRLLEVWFAEKTEDNKTELISSVIFDSGSWGKIESGILSQVIRDSKHAPLGVRGKLVYLWKKVFPGTAVLQSKYKILKTMPWMLPLVWLVRPFYKVIFEFGTLRQHGKNIGALTPENLEQRQQLLNYVGLDYHF